MKAVLLLFAAAASALREPASGLTGVELRGPVDAQGEGLEVRGGDLPTGAPASPAVTTAVVAAYVAAGLSAMTVRAGVAVAKGRSVPVPSKWQAALAAAWVANNVAVLVPGRYDSVPPDKTTAAKANLLTPAGWAFGIWGPIFGGEALMMALLTSAHAEDQSFDFGKAIGPSWCVGALCQVAWCATFRPEVCGPEALWVPTACLAGGAWAMGRAHRALSTCYNPFMAGQVAGLRDDFLIRWPLALHFGWLCCATLVNFNKWLAESAKPLALKEAAALASVAAAVAVAAFVFRTTKDPLVGAVVAWGLAAVAMDAGKQAARGLVPDGPVDRVAVAAGLASAYTAVAYFLFPALWDFSFAWRAVAFYQKFGAARQTSVAHPEVWAENVPHIG